MLFSDTVDLITFSDDTDDNGDPKEVETGRNTVFADKKSIRQSEFYAAAEHQVNLTQMFLVRTIDYGGERKLEYGGKPYYVVRTYDKGNGMTELVCNDKRYSGGSHGS